MCDVFIELSKPVLSGEGGEPELVQTTRDTLWVCLDTGLRRARLLCRQSGSAWMATTCSLMCSAGSCVARAGLAAVPACSLPARMPCWSCVSECMVPRRMC
jgi:hypothetical protein